ncbi:hypothetical protein Rcae01_06544 [Novipirellula caenicola]|uniref:Uncharacterized protein n=1 Tax=Novipirellula caenicola TaxID=1536901 RepID=A0ABP9W1Q9_9BACT
MPKRGRSPPTKLLFQRTILSSKPSIHIHTELTDANQHSILASESG